MTTKLITPRHRFSVASLLTRIALPITQGRAKPC